MAAVVIGSATGLAISAGGAAGAATGTSGATWGAARDIPGLAALANNGGGLNPAKVSAVGCGSAANCVAVGDYTQPVAPGNTVPFVSTETDGTWGDAQPLAGLPTLATGSTANLTSVSCGTPDSCTAVGNFAAATGGLQIFAVTETDGTWGTPAVLDTSVQGDVQSIGVDGLSCSAAGECALVGDYTPVTTGAVAVPVPFTVDESAGTWGAVQPLAGLASLQPAPGNLPAGDSSLTTVSCGAVGDCTAGGVYAYGEYQEPFIVSEAGHVWGQPQPIPALSSGGQYSEGPNEVTSVSCPDATDCAVVGTYFPQINASGEIFTVDEAAGVWGQANTLSIPSTDAVGNSGTDFVSCRSAGDCVIAGTAGEVVTATESSAGAWSAATAIPGTAPADGDDVTDLACVPKGDCTLLGVDTPGNQLPYEVFSATSPDGSPFGSAQEVASSGNDDVQGNPQLACPQNGQCTVTYNGLSSTTGLSFPQLVTELSTATITLSASALKATYGAEQAVTLTATASSAAGGTPTGAVSVTGPGGTPVCSITLTGGTGSCTLTSRQLPVGTDTLTAAYAGDDSYLSASSTTTITIVHGRGL
jgi:hypothetical protein